MTAWAGTLPDTDTVAGGTIFAADIMILVNALHGLSDAWTDFSASVGWSASTPPAIGNGTILAQYIQVGKLVIYKGRITMGSTTTFGSGSWTVNLPVTSVGLNIGAAMAFDASTTANKQSAAIEGTGATSCNLFGVGGPFSATLPFVWAISDRFDWCIVYEAA